MKKLLLINPVGRRSGYLVSKYSTFQPLSLAYIAAVTPPHWEVEIIDENIEEFTFKHCDLVGITAFTSNINRAYQLARIYREQNIKVILGGIHSSMLPDEALQHCDSVVIGEAEEIWSQVISDFENKHLLPKYNGPRVDLLKTSIMPRHDLLHPNYFWNSVQTSRGCPFNCNFCSVSRYLGKEYRQRPINDVLAELKKIKGKFITFIDDNLIGYSQENRSRSMELFKGMIHLNLEKKWWMQCSINAAEDEDVLEMAAQAGCMYAFIGFETLNKETLGGMKKGINIKIGVENYKKVVKRFHRYGIAVLGSFVIGNDNESLEYYHELGNFLVSSGIDIIQISILTPLPGTDLMEQMQKEERLIYNDLPDDWDKYRFSYVVHQPRGVEQDIIYIGNDYIKKKIYSFPFYQLRLINSACNIQDLTNIFALYKLNQSMKKSWQATHYHKKLSSAKKSMVSL